MNRLKCNNCKNLLMRLGPFTCPLHKNGIPDETLETGCDKFDDARINTPQPLHIVNLIEHNGTDNFSWCGVKVPFISSFVHRSIDDALRAAHLRTGSTPKELPCRHCLRKIMEKIEVEMNT